MRKYCIVVAFGLITVLLNGCLSMPGPSQSSPQPQYQYQPPQQQNQQQQQPNSYQNKGNDSQSHTTTLSSDEEIFINQLLPIYIYYKGLLFYESKYAVSITNQVASTFGGKSNEDYKTFITFTKNTVSDTVSRRMKELKKDLKYSKSAPEVRTAYDSLDSRINQYLGSTHMDALNIDNVFTTLVAKYKLLPSDVNRQIIDYAQYMANITTPAVQKQLDTYTGGTLKINSP